MKTITLVFVAIFAVVSCSEDYCYKDTVRACKPTTNKQLVALPNCNAKYGSIDGLQSDLQRFANHHFLRSFDLLLMSTHYGNYEKNRVGFEKLFRKISDSLWHEGIELIKYITKRGGDMDFNNVNTEIKEESSTPNWELYEIESLAKALDIEKNLAKEAFQIHQQATRIKVENHDPEVASYLEEEFMHEQRDVIRQLSGYTTDLSTLLDGPDSSLALYLFDEHLQKEI
ncbi:ferritin-2 heavy chain [Cylas formicarius]|uniref:ferritin-2 heavy chain n=1 Tax=Cylas formicarius TaxID=197179 RepID=UPI002958B02F|nr:ferritin-2 heavy chain [Cylas formicarius]XP_060529380.1 ferritin-2 heavy chain [Cylas formicarius]